MKSFQGLILVIALHMGLSAKAQSLSSIGPIAATISKSAQLELEAFTLNLGLVTDKFNDYAGARLLFNASSIEIDIQKRTPKCGPNKVCVEMVLAPSIIKLSVVKIEHIKCKDIYYASAGAGGDLNLVEQIILVDNSRCEALIPMESHLTYRVDNNGNINKPELAAYVEFSIDSFLGPATK